jgi:hypothetical protein
MEWTSVCKLCPMRKYIRFCSLLTVVSLFLASCYTYKPLAGPYAGAIPNKLKEGKRVRLTLVNGNEMLGENKVQQVWNDSLALDVDFNDVRVRKIVRISEVGKISTLQFNLGLTVVAVLTPVIVIGVIEVATSSNPALGTVK